jgi:hypothetical protein
MAWVTTQPVPDAGMVWSALSDAHDQTGLVPFLLAGLRGAPERPWDTRDFGAPADVAWLGHLDAAELLEEMWEGHLPTEYEDQELGGPWTAMRAPLSRQFPGLAPAEDQQLSQEQRQQVLSALPPARIGLVAARRPADALPLVGLPMTDQFDNALPVAACCGPGKTGSGRSCCKSASLTSGCWPKDPRRRWRTPISSPLRYSHSATNTAGTASTTSPGSPPP